MARSALLNVMVGSVDKAGRSLARDFGEVEHLQVSRKGPADFVSKADTRAEEILQRELSKARPSYGFLGEEGTDETGDGQNRWICDPLDGTTNFLHGVPLFCISLALERQGELVAGVIYNPVMQELFVAERGQGAFLNDRRLRVAARTDLADSLVGCGLPFLGHGDHVQALAELQPLFGRVAGLRAMGSSALELAFVAAGRHDACFEHSLKAWDMAAGIVLIREAGGFVSDAEGKDRMLATGSIVAGNESVQRALLRQLTEARMTRPARTSPAAAG